MCIRVQWCTYDKQVAGVTFLLLPVWSIWPKLRSLSVVHITLPTESSHQLVNYAFFPLWCTTDSLQSSAGCEASEHIFVTANGSGALGEPRVDTKMDSLEALQIQISSLSFPLLFGSSEWWH